MKANQNKIVPKQTPSTNPLSHKKTISLTTKNQSQLNHKQPTSRTNYNNLSQQSTKDNLSFISAPSSIYKSESQQSFLSEKENEFEDQNQHQCKNIFGSLGKNQMNIIFQFCTFKYLISIRGVSKSWKIMIDNYLDQEIPHWINEKNQLETLVNTQMESESSHTKYVRAYKQVSLGHDLIFNLGQIDAEQFYLLKDKSEYIKEIRSIIHQLIGINIIEKDKQIKKYSVQYYLSVIPGCKEVSVSEIPRELINRMKNLVHYNHDMTDEKLSQISKYAYALKVLISGYLHLYLEMNPLLIQKIRLEKLKDDIHCLKKYNQHKSLTH